MLHRVVDGCLTAYTVDLRTHGRWVFVQGLSLVGVVTVV